ncbi:MAG: type II toxin-antitoxin system RatA family toxin [Pseudomonadota bacterium]
MKSVQKSVLIWYSAEEMFRLVADVPSYPAFLPWCSHAKVLAEDATGMTAEVGIHFSGIRQSFTTRNTHFGVERIHLQLVDGPFSQLDGEWRFVTLGPTTDAAAGRACRVELQLNYGFDNAALAMLVGPVFDRIAGSLVDAFVKRAEQVYG